MLSIETSAFGTVDLLPLLVGTIFLLAGWMLYWVSLNFSGAILAGGLGFLGADALRGFLEIEGEFATMALWIGCTLVGALLGLLAIRFLHKFAFFIAGFALGALGWFYTIDALRQGGEIAWVQNDALFALGVPLCGLVLGIVSVLMHRYLIALASAILGSILIMSGINWAWGAVPVVPLALLGFVFQVWMTGKKRGRVEKE